MIGRALLLALLPLMAQADHYDGVYKQTATSDCTDIGVDGGALKIADGVFVGVGMECAMTGAVSVSDMDATLYNMACSGEDQSWIERAMVMHAAQGDGIIMVWNGFAFAYERCEDAVD